MKITSQISSKGLSMLPLSLAGTLLGSMLAAADYHVGWTVAVSMAFTSVLLHLYCNHAGGKKGVRTGILVLTVMSAMLTVRLSLGRVLMMESLILLFFGFFAVRMTFAKDSPMGGLWRDVSAFLYYGPFLVLVSYYVCSHSFGTWMTALPAVSIGFMSIACMRADDGSRVVRIVLMVLGWIAMTAYSCMRMFDPWHYLFVLSLPLFFMRRKELSVLAFSLLAGIGFLIYLL